MVSSFALIDQQRGGAENMAIDDAMLNLAAGRQIAVLRIYRWSRPTLSLGYFQLHDDRFTHPESSELELVRRSTGGGAIVHHHDWTYSIALPSSALPESVGAAQTLYDCIHDAVVDWLRKADFGDARKWDEAAETQKCKAEGCSFLCFERRTTGDIVIGNSKVMGSAQRRHRGGLLQHGSLLLQQSPYAPSLRGLRELASTGDTSWNEPDIEPFFDRMCDRVASFLSTTVSVIDDLQTILEAPTPRGKYETQAWNLKR